jgi:hypothetical protein
MLQCPHCRTIKLKPVGKTSYGFEMVACRNCGSLYVDPSYFKPIHEGTVPEKVKGMKEVEWRTFQ